MEFSMRYSDRSREKPHVFACLAKDGTRLYIHTTKVAAFAVKMRLLAPAPTVDPDPLTVPEVEA